MGGALAALLLAVAAAVAPLAGAINLLHPFSRDTALGSKLPKPPQWPKNYEVAYNFSLPYESSIPGQEGGLSIDVKIWHDASNKRVRMDSYDSSNILIQSKSQDLEITPRIDRLTCLRYAADEEDSILSAPVLPDLSLWDFRGTETLQGQPAGLWVLEQRHGSKHTVYKFYVDHDGQPLRLHMHGNDMFSGAHFDVYVVDYVQGSFRPSVDASVFDVPSLCSNATQRPTKSRYRSLPSQMKAHLPFMLHRGDDEYNAWTLQHRRRHASQAEADMRKSVFHANRNLVDTGLSSALADRAYTLQLNQFADWTQDEFMAIMLPGGGLRGRARNGPGSGLLPYERKVPKGRLPSAVDWRHPGIDAQVKDQAACGSCWAFGTTGMLQGAYWLATGNASSFSEQQLVDCSWGYGMNQACGGGDFDAAVDYLAEAGGALPEASYPYRGADGFCKDAKHSGAASVLAPVKFKGYAMVPSYDDEALMEAVYSRGPLAVTLDAAQPGFRFYASGVYSSPTCHWKEEDLDHVVTLVGYGTCHHTGEDYWLVRNSWSTHWGDHGYVKIARNGSKGKGTDCGLTTSSAYAVFA